MRKVISYRFLIFAIFLLPFFVACNNNRNVSDIQDVQKIQQAIDGNNGNIEKLNSCIQQFEEEKTVENFQQAIDQIKKCDFSYTEEGLTEEQKKKCQQQKINADKLMESSLSFLKDNVKKIKAPVLSKEDYLMSHGMETYPVYAKKGDILYINASSEESFTLKVYNADSHHLIKTYKKKKSISDSIKILNKAIYLIDLKPSSQQYVDIAINQSVSSIERIGHPVEIKKDEVSAKPGDFHAYTIKGIKLKKIFNEPRKITLRGKLKAFFSGSARALVAINVPAGATDILYSLHVSTNETTESEDGDFYNNLSTSYHQIRALGLPIYESQRSSGILATILGDNLPSQEEDAYVDMYVIMNPVQARKFQNGQSISKIKYNLDYSTMGTQSCNGRISARKRKTIYLGFENERMRFYNYIWIEATSVTPRTEYIKDVYSVK